MNSPDPTLFEIYGISDENAQLFYEDLPEGIPTLPGYNYEALWDKVVSYYAETSILYPQVALFFGILDSPTEGSIEDIRTLFNWVLDSPGVDKEVLKEKVVDLLSQVVLGGYPLDFFEKLLPYLQVPRGGGGKEVKRLLEVIITQILLGDANFDSLVSLLKRGFDSELFLDLMEEQRVTVEDFLDLDPPEVIRRYLDAIID